jgi:hypothetical protein
MQPQRSKASANLITEDKSGSLPYSCREVGRSSGTYAGRASKASQGCSALDAHSTVPQRELFKSLAQEGRGRSLSRAQRDRSFPPDRPLVMRPARNGRRRGSAQLHRAVRPRGEARWQAGVIH